MSNGRIGPPWWLMGRGTGGSRTVSGAVAHWEDKVVAPLRSLLVNIEPVQEGTGDPSPDNVRPISGWSAVNVWRTGVNPWDEEWESGQFSGNPSTGVIGTAQDNTRIRTVNDVPVMPLTTYYVHSPQPLFAYFLDENKTWLNRVGSNGTTLAKNATFTTPENCRFMKFFTINTPTYNNDISINYPSTDHDYHAYTGNQYTIQLGDTYYGGTLDVTNGVLTVDRAYVDLSAVTWQTTNPQNGIYWLYKHQLEALGIEWIRNNSATMNGISSRYKAIPGSASHENSGTMWETTTGNWFGICDTNYANYTTEQFAQAMAGVQFVFKLATPITIPLTATEISSLQGENNVWADSGDVTVTYLSGEGNPALVALALAHRIEE